MDTQPLSPADTQKIVRDLQKRVTDLEAAGKVFNAASTIDRNLDNPSKVILNQETAKHALDIVWDQYFYWFTFFESLDGYAGAGDVVSNTTRLFLRTSAVEDNVAWAQKISVYQNVLTFDLESRFRTSFDFANVLGAGVLTDIKGYVGTGYSRTGATDFFTDGLAGGSHYGFYLEDDNLYGITSDGVTHSTLLLLEGMTNYDLRFVEARHFPGNKVTFYMSEGTDAINPNNQIVPLREFGSISTTLPTGFRASIMNVAVQNNDSAGGTREMDVGFWEFAQRRVPL